MNGNEKTMYLNAAQWRAIDTALLNAESRGNDPIEESYKAPQSTELAGITSSTSPLQELQKICPDATETTFLFVLTNLINTPETEVKIVEPGNSESHFCKECSLCTPEGTCNKRRGIIPQLSCNTLKKESSSPRYNRSHYVVRRGCTVLSEK